MWKVDPRVLCKQHLLGEHVEMHMFVGAIDKQKNIQGYINKGFVEVHNIKKRHDQLAREMLRRSINHKSPVNQPKVENPIGEINIENAKNDLLNRCPECKARFNALVFGKQL